jgi:3-dehydroquinate dehydratase-2
MTLAQLNSTIRKEAQGMGVSVRIFQRNGEGELIDLLCLHRRWSQGILINPGAYTHYSYALLDALVAVRRPTVEVHLSDIQKREKWRRVSVVAEACAARFMGKGAESYLEGLRWLAGRLKA